MSKIKIGTDSTADIPKPFCEELNISVLPLSILAGEKEYQDGVDITPSEFYRIIDESKELPVSSQVASVLYSELFEETWKAGYTDLIQVTLNSKGSGTYQAAVLSRNLFYEEHPEAKEQLAIHIIDSKTYSMAYGIGVIEGAQLVQNGASVEEVIAHIKDWLEHTRPVFVPLNLRCVKKSGRISPAVTARGASRRPFAFLCASIRILVNSFSVSASTVPFLYSPSSASSITPLASISSSVSPASFSTASSVSGVYTSAPLCSSAFSMSVRYSGTSPPAFCSSVSAAL